MSIDHQFLELEDLPREDTSVPEGMGEEAVAALEAGERYAARVLYRSGQGLPRKVPQEQLQTLRELARANSTAIHLFISLFYLGIYQDLKDRPDETGHALRIARHASAFSKRHMVQSVLHMPPDVRIQLHHEHRVLEQEYLHWWHNWLDAVAVARTLDALMAEGLTVYLPTAEDDRFGRLDLIARFRKGHRGLCVRVNAKKHDEIDILPLVIKKALERHRFLEHMKMTREIERVYKNRWLPIYVRIGYKVGDPGLVSMHTKQRKRFASRLKIIDAHYDELDEAFRKLDF